MAILKSTEEFNDLSKHFSKDLKDMREFFTQISGVRIWAEGIASSKALKGACVEKGAGGARRETAGGEAKEAAGARTQVPYTLLCQPQEELNLPV